MIYLFGLIDRPVPKDNELAGTTGIGDEICTTRFEDWTIVHEDHDTSEVVPRRRTMLAHTRVVEAMMALGTVLPARFGLVAESIEHVTALIDARRDAIAKEIVKLSGCVELGVRLSFPHESALAATLQADRNLTVMRDKLLGKGREAHFARADFGRALAEALDRRRGAAQREILNALLPNVRNHVLRKPESDAEVLRAEFLVPEHSQAEVIAKVEALAASCLFAPGATPDLRIVGPAPAYNFVRLSLAADADAQSAA